MTFLKTMLASSALIVAMTPVMAADFKVQMLNKGEAGTLVFEPALTRVAPGDTVTFVPTDKGHNAESITDIMPEGAQPFKGGISQEVAVTFDEPGVYGVKCLPHFALGMVALVVVGAAPPNVAQIEGAKVPKKAHERLEAIAAQLTP
jgi:pseudoazurin